jgi:hypothetical protein
MMYAATVRVLDWLPVAALANASLLPTPWCYITSGVLSVAPIDA